jgi:arylsulfatase A-like enzyme
LEEHEQQKARDAGATNERTRSTASPVAHLLGWLVVALVSSVGFSGMHLLPVIALHIGHCAAAGLISFVALHLWRRTPLYKRPRFAGAAFFIAAATVATYSLAPDFEGFASRLNTPLPVTPLTWLLAWGVAAGLVLAEWLASTPRTWLQLSTVALAGAVAVENSLLLAHNYPGVHLFAAWGSAVLFGSASPRLGGLVAARLRLTRPRLLASRRAQAALLLLLAAGAVASLAIRPKNAVMVQLLCQPGAVIAPFSMALHDRTIVAARVSGPNAPWFSDRSQLPAVPPSKPGMEVDKPIVLLITIDALRADLLVEEHRAKLPTLMALQARGVRFTRTRAPSSETMLSLVTMTTGRYFSQLRWQHMKGVSKTVPLGDTSTSFPKLLSSAGVRSVHVEPFPAYNEKTGIMRGFDDSVFPRKNRSKFMMDAFIKELKKHDSGPLFMFMHLIDPHAPYNRSTTKGTEFERYVGEVGLADRQIGRLLEVIEKRGLTKRTILIVSADHGEAFGEHNTRFHAVTVYDELLRVPLIVTGPGLEARSVDTPVSLIDLGPTVLDMFGQPTPGAFFGESLLPALFGRPFTPTRPIAAESRLGKQTLIFADGYKLIWDRNRHLAELYDLNDDPKELKDCFDPSDPDAARRLGLLHLFFQANRPSLKK